MGELRVRDASPAASPGASHRRRRLGPLVIGIVALLVLGGSALVRRAGPAPPTAAGSGLLQMLDVPVAQQLSWAPPALVNPTVVRVDENHHTLNLDPDRDYVVSLPARPVVLDGGLVVLGGRNVVLIGGEIEVPAASTAPKTAQRRGLYLRDQRGTVHIEGLRIDGPDLAEGIDLDQRQGAVVQLENIQLGTVQGSYETNHADLLQTWAGPRVLRVDGLQGTTGYQGLFLLPDEYGTQLPDNFDLRRIVISATSTAGYLLWTDDSAPWMSTSDLVLVDDPARDRALDKVVHPLGPWEDGVRLQHDRSDLHLPAGSPPASAT